MFEYILMFLALCAFGRLGRRERHMVLEPAHAVITFRGPACLEGRGYSVK